MESEAQKRANIKWKNNHRSKQNYYRCKSATKKFINTMATLSDLEKIKYWLNKRKNNLK